MWAACRRRTSRVRYQPRVFAVIPGALVSGRSPPPSILLDTANLKRKHHESWVIATDFVSGTELRCLPSGGQVRPQTFEPLVADDVGRMGVPRPGLPLPVGVAGTAQPRPPHSHRLVAPCLQIDVHLLPTVLGSRDPRDIRFRDRLRNPPDAHGRGTHHGAEQAHHRHLHRHSADPSSAAVAVTLPAARRACVRRVRFRCPPG